MLGPGQYLADITEGIENVDQLPEPKITQRSRNYQRRICPDCGGKTYRKRTQTRRLHELGDRQRPHEIELTVSQHLCPACKKYFMADTSNIAAPGGRYTTSVVSLTVKLVVEAGMPYRAASWHMWTAHRVYVPFGTIQNWVEAAGKKGA